MGEGLNADWLINWELCLWVQLCPNHCSSVQCMYFCWRCTNLPVSILLHFTLTVDKTSRYLKCHLLGRQLTPNSDLAILPFLVPVLKELLVAIISKVATGWILYSKDFRRSPLDLTDSDSWRVVSVSASLENAFLYTLRHVVSRMDAFVAGVYKRNSRPKTTTKIFVIWYESHWKNRPVYCSSFYFWYK